MPQPRSDSPNTVFLKGMAAIAAALAIMWALLSSHQQPGNGLPAAGLPVGSPLPRIKAAGWLNGPAPRLGELNGKVLVIDAWASWCGPCRAKAPEMVVLYEKYRPQGVEFIGLTSESEHEMEAMEEFLTSTGIKWRNGYGAVQTLTDLQADYIPMVWVVDREGKIAWTDHSPLSLDEGIQQALDAKVLSNKGP